MCIDEIGGTNKFFEFYAKGFTQESTDALAKIASDLGINMDKYNTCMSDKRYEGTIDRDFTDGTNAGVTGTPGFVIGVLDKDGNVKGKLVSGAYPYESFKAIIDEML